MRSPTVRFRVALAAGLLLVVLPGCRAAPPAPVCASTPAPVGPCPPIAVAVVTDPLDVAAARSVRAARVAEPAVTKSLRALAQQGGGELVGLDHRLKTFSSTRRKIKTHVEETGAAPDAYEVYDGLRYTLLVEDAPPGRHAEVVRTTLAALEGEGHVVDRVKNYWPRGDTYSGTNSRLRTPSGQPWELQFHTPASWATKSETHDDYDVMRADDTPLEEKRALFDAMARLWDDVPVPEGILEPGAIHAKEEIELLPAP